jgi:hypothetical protein
MHMPLRKTRSIGFVLFVLSFLGNSSAFLVPSALPLSRLSGSCGQVQRRPAASRIAGAAALRAITWPWETQAKPQDNKVQREAKREELLQVEITHHSLSLSNCHFIDAVGDVVVDAIFTHFVHQNKEKCFSASCKT